MSAVAQRTKRINFGPLVYTLPLYHPIRLIEEICMLDQMSGGRFQFGVGKGISPIEVAYYGLDPAQARQDVHRGVRGADARAAEPHARFRGRVLPFQERAARARAVAEAASAAVVRRRHAGEHRAPCPRRHEHRHQPAGACRAQADRSTTGRCIPAMSRARRPAWRGTSWSPTPTRRRSRSRGAAIAVVRELHEAVAGARQQAGRCRLPGRVRRRRR